MKSPSTSWIVASAMIVTASISHAQKLQSEANTQIGWATEAFAKNVMADGVTTFESSGEPIHFELGTFAAGFDPTTATPEEWVTNWIILQGAEYDLVNQQVIQTATLTSSDTDFTSNAGVFIWGYTSKNVVPESQWLLVSSQEWRWPSPTNPLPTTFSMSDARPGDALIGYVNPANQAFHMQFDYVTVPEPSAALLGMLGAFGVVLRRRR